MIKKYKMNSNIDRRLYANGIAKFCYIDALLIKSIVKVHNRENDDDELNAVRRKAETTLYLLYWMISLEH
jgi:hypothetical protein